MRHVFPIALVMVAIVLIMGRSTLSAQGTQGAITVSNQNTLLNFPDQITFNAHLTADTEIKRVILEYGVERRTCSPVIAEGFPIVTPGTAMDVSWTWNMHKSGSEPPGATIWYRWQVTDKNGNVSGSPKMSVVWLDNQHSWSSVTQDMLTLHWYEGSATFANDLLNSAVLSLHQLSQKTGVTPDAPIDLYIYDGYNALHQATLYQPGWTGGLAYPDYDITLIGISPSNETWGKRAEAHELTHVLIGHLVSGCETQIPTWLNEGLAVYGEGGPEAPSLAIFQTALASNTLLPIHVISGNFSEVPSTADLAYSESYSIVNFLVTQYGQSDMLTLLGNIRQGMVIDAALQSTYGFGLDELETRWRTAIGASVRAAAATTPTVSPTPTYIPTYQPVGSDATTAS